MRWNVKLKIIVILINLFYVWMIMSCPFISANIVLYSENFDDGIADNWVNIGGTWTIENDKYKVIGSPEERVRSYYTNMNFSTYVYEGDFNLILGNEMQIIFNIQDIYPGVDQGHYCQITLFYDDLYGRKDTAVLYSTQNNQIEHIKTSYNFKYNQWYHFKVVSFGNIVKFYLNSSLIFSYSGIFYTHGYIGLKSMYGPIAYWDNIIVNKIEVENNPILIIFISIIISGAGIGVITLLIILYIRKKRDFF